MPSENNGLPIDESLSALMDGEVQAFEFRRVLNRLSDESGARAKWARYQLVSSMLRQEPCVPFVSMAIADAVQSSIEAEKVQKDKKLSLGTGYFAASGNVAKFAVAASVALAVVLGAQWMESGQPDVTRHQLATVQQRIPVASQPVSQDSLKKQQAAEVSAVDKTAQHDLFAQYTFDRALMGAASAPVMLTPASSSPNKQK